MREIIAVCRSGKKSRDRVAEVLDRYFWRIGDRTWRGRATNACLDRAARELRSRATRNTAVTIQEIRSSRESRTPLIWIGARSAFSDDGLVPVASHPAAFRRLSDGAPTEISAAAVVRISALFHDLGKATVLFQEKLRRALRGGPPEADGVRHELFSAAVWDKLFGAVADADLAARLKATTPLEIDDACGAVATKLVDLRSKAATNPATNFAFVNRPGTLVHAVGMLILTHHRLPDGESSHRQILVGRHVNTAGNLTKSDLAIAPGTPFWHEEWWLRRLHRDAGSLTPGVGIPGLDMALRAALMLSDHVGSASKKISDENSVHLANTKDGKPADSLSLHVHRVYRNCRGSFDMMHRYRERFPGLGDNQIPTEILYPEPLAPRFYWQAEAAQAARDVCAAQEGGFIGFILSGTGTGKTRGAPTILANAAINDAIPARRYLRMTLGLGLRVLATQSAGEYVADLGFRDEDVSVLVGQAPITFEDPDPPGDDGSESLITLPDWLRVEMANGGVPQEGSDAEEDWLRSLSLDTGRGLPAFCDKVLAAAGPRGGDARRLVVPPIMVGTIDHLMGVAAPVNSRFLIQSIRALTADLILDEIDQYGPEDIAALCRLVYQAAAGGRRVIAMSATLTPDIAVALHTAYRRGWADFAALQGLADHVNLLCTSDAPGSCFTNADGRDIAAVFSDCRSAILDGIAAAPPLRRGEILPPCSDWPALVDQTDQGCARLHADHAVPINGFNVSVGLVRLTRISHTAAMAAQLPAGLVDGRLRVKLCLHSLFPRLHRAWIEMRLKRMLTRKGEDPEAGLLALCRAEGLFDRAAAIGARDIEIVVITSPVIETGNDLDFDWAILDPISIRSIIQAAGRVRRHRPPFSAQPNILIMGRSPVAMETGSLSMPGIETELPGDTCVSPRSLALFVDRHFRELAGDEDFARIDAAAALSETGTAPLRYEEAQLRQAMIDPATTPLAAYIESVNARLNLAMTRSRKFRRSATRDVLYTMLGDDIDDAEWYGDLAPGTRQSRLELVSEDRLRTVLEFPNGNDGLLFSSLTRRAWNDHAEGRQELTSMDIRTLMQVTVPVYGQRDNFPDMTYSEFTGFTRGSPEDLFGPRKKSE